jgi:hypothetical protein
MKKFQIFYLFLVIILLISGCDDVVPGSEETRSETITAVVFVDENVNGRFDANEPPIPDTLVLAQSNVHGSFTQAAALKHADGAVDLSANTTHIFDVAVVPPCGFEATTAIILSADSADDSVLAFGFRRYYKSNTI